MVFILVIGLLHTAPCFAQTAESYRKQAIEFSRSKSWDQAIENYRQALAIEPDDADTHYNFALTLKYKGEARTAVEEFEAAARLSRSGPIRTMGSRHVVRFARHRRRPQRARTARTARSGKCRCPTFARARYLEQNNPSAAWANCGGRSS
jgi:tetratricopeptide (TPR) repeat protein